MARSTGRAALLFLAVNRSPANCLVSVIVLNYNGARWLERCLNSLRAQTIFDQMEVILADNASSDGSDQFGKGIVEAWPAGVFMEHGQNLGYCEGNNRAAGAAICSCASPTASKSVSAAPANKFAPAFTIIRPASTMAFPPEKIPCRR